VSRAGIVYISDTDLDWPPVLQAWIRTRPLDQQGVLAQLFTTHVGTCAPEAPGHLFDFLTRHTSTASVLSITRVGAITSTINLLSSLLQGCEQLLTHLAATAKSAAKSRAMGSDTLMGGSAGARGGAGADAPADTAALLASSFGQAVERLLLYALSWSLGGLLESDDRLKWDAYLRSRSPSSMPPTGLSKAGKGAAGAAAAAAASAEDVDTIFEWYPDLTTTAGASTPADPLPWRRWAAPAWEYPKTENLDFSNLLVPTMDSTRAISILDHLHRRGKPVLLVGGPGTAKTSTALMYFSGFDTAKRVLKRVNFSSATTPGNFQTTIDADLDKRGGKSFGPPNGKAMTVFIDDASMPTINTWGDQPTNELVRQLIEASGYYFLEKDKRGDFKTCEDMQYVAAMQQPVGGRNDIPNRMKRHFFAFNLVLPAIGSINDLYGKMLLGRFAAPEFKESCLEVVRRLTSATIELWKYAKNRFLPTPAKFHYIFNMRELSRVFQGVLLTPKDTVKTGGQQAPSTDQGMNLLRLWKHEANRVFQDKLTNTGQWRAHAACVG